MKDTRGGGKARREAGAQQRAVTRQAVVGDVRKADTDENPQRRELNARQKRIEWRSTGALTGADGAAGQRDAGSTVGTTNSAAKNEKPDMMLRYSTNGVLYWCAGGVHRAAVRSRAALPEALAGILSAGSRMARGDMEHHRCRLERRAYEVRSGYCVPHGRFTCASSVRDITIVESQRPASNLSTSRATIQSASKPLLPSKSTPGVPEGERVGERRQSTRIGEPPEKRVGRQSGAGVGHTGGTHE